MRLAFILNNLPRHPVPRPHGRAGFGGKPVVGQGVYAMIAAERRHKLKTQQLLAQLIARRGAFEERLAEARRQQSLLKTQLYATLLSEL